MDRNKSIGLMHRIGAGRVDWDVVESWLRALIADGNNMAWIATEAVDLPL